MYRTCTIDNALVLLLFFTYISFVENFVFQESSSFARYDARTHSSTLENRHIFNTVFDSSASYNSNFGMKLWGRLVSQSMSSRSTHNFYRSDYGSLKLATFNVLAPCYKRVHDYKGHVKAREAQFPELWEERTNLLRDFLVNDMTDTDIFCLQEYWFHNNFDGTIRSTLGDNYDFYVAQRTGDKQDGLAILLRKGRFDVSHIEPISLGHVGDRIALALKVFDRYTGQHLVLANTHLSFPHNAIDRQVQMNQVKKLMNKLTDFGDAGMLQVNDGSYRHHHQHHHHQHQHQHQTFAEENGESPTTMIITGDFNNELDEPVCNYIMSQGFVEAYEQFHKVGEGQHFVKKGKDLFVSAPTYEHTYPSSSHIGADCIAAEISPLPVPVPVPVPLPVPLPVPAKTSFGDFLSSSVGVGSGLGAGLGLGGGVRAMLSHNGIIREDKSVSSSSSSSSSTAHPSGPLSHPYLRRFVSHLTHKGDEVGVDHVFIRCSGSSVSSGSSISGVSSSSTTGAGIHVPISSPLIGAALLYPKQQPINRWSSRFSPLSDHRPKVVEMFFPNLLPKQEQEQDQGQGKIQEKGQRQEQQQERGEHGVNWAPASTSADRWSSSSDGAAGGLSLPKIDKTDQQVYLYDRDGSDGATAETGAAPGKRAQPKPKRQLQLKRGEENQRKHAHHYQQQQHQQQPPPRNKHGSNNIRERHSAQRVLAAATASRHDAAPVKANASLSNNRSSNTTMDAHTPSPNETRKGNRGYEQRSDFGNG